MIARPRLVLIAGAAVLWENNPVEVFSDNWGSCGIVKPDARYKSEARTGRRWDDPLLLTTDGPRKSKVYPMCAKKEKKKIYIRSTTGTAAVLILLIYTIYGFSTQTAATPRRSRGGRVVTNLFRPRSVHPSPRYLE